MPEISFHPAKGLNQQPLDYNSVALSNLAKQYRINIMTYNYAPFEEEVVYCFTNVGRSVDHMVSADYIEKNIYITKVSYFTCRLVMTSRLSL